MVFSRDQCSGHDERGAGRAGVDPDTHEAIDQATAAMTRNAIRRDHNDPHWSGRLVEGSDKGWDYDEQDFDHLSTHLDRAQYLVKKMRNKEFHGMDDDHGIVGLDQAIEMAVLFETVDNLQRYLPWVMGWCVCRKYIISNPGDEQEEYFDVMTAHRTRESADEWVKVTRAENPRYAYVIRYTATSIIKFMHPDARPGDARWGCVS